MEKDCEDIDEIDELTDGELRALIRDCLECPVAMKAGSYRTRHRT